MQKFVCINVVLHTHINQGSSASEATLKTMDKNDQNQTKIQHHIFIILS